MKYEFNLNIDNYIETEIKMEVEFPVFMKETYNYAQYFIKINNEFDGVAIKYGPTNDLQLQILPLYSGFENNENHLTQSLSKHLYNVYYKKFNHSSKYELITEVEFNEKLEEYKNYIDDFVESGASEEGVKKNKVD